MQPRHEIEASYATPDPWGYQTNPEDIRRREIILDRAARFAPHATRALDLGCGEAWITAGLGVPEKHGWELSLQARARFPASVVAIEMPAGTYDLVMATGVLYAHYDTRTFFTLMRVHASDVILTCNIKDWETPELMARFGDRQIHDEEFPYREYTQKLRVFEV